LNAVQNDAIKPLLDRAEGLPELVSVYIEGVVADWFRKPMIEFSEEGPSWQ